MPSMCMASRHGPSTIWSKQWRVRDIEKLGQLPSCEDRRAGGCLSPPPHRGRVALSVDRCDLRQSPRGGPYRVHGDDNRFRHEPTAGVTSSASPPAPRRPSRSGRAPCVRSPIAACAASSSSSPTTTRDCGRPHRRSSTHLAAMPRPLDAQPVDPRSGQAASGGDRDCQDDLRAANRRGGTLPVENGGRRAARARAQARRADGRFAGLRACLHRLPQGALAPIASTNPLERLNGEIKRRSNVVGIFQNDRAVIRLVGALMLEQNDEWADGRRYMSPESLAPVSNHPLVKLPGVAA